ncbi:MAG TPA: hypothetical protein DCO67_01460, partial [Staphylococcus sp.]|nr:hypothetical protein [Staphylococcus sp.]
STFWVQYSLGLTLELTHDFASHSQNPSYPISLNTPKSHQINFGGFPYSFSLYLDDLIFLLRDLNYNIID